MKVASHWRDNARECEYVTIEVSREELEHSWNHNELRDELARVVIRRAAYAYKPKPKLAAGTWRSRLTRDPGVAISRNITKTTRYED